MVYVDQQAGDETRGQAATSQQPGTSSGHFVYDKQQMHEIAQKWDELAEHFLVSSFNSASMATVEGPGGEYASGSHAVDANISGSAYLSSLKTSRDYCRDQAAKYRKVLGETVNSDEESHRKLQQPSSPLDGGV